jgi:hypothetical protein
MEIRRVRTEAELGKRFPKSLYRAESDCCVHQPEHHPRRRPTVLILSFET